MFMLSESVAHGELVCRVWGLPLNTHISNRLPLYDEIRKRMLTFFRSTSKSRPNNIRGKMSVRPSVRPQKVSSI